MPKTGGAGVAPGGPKEINLALQGGGSHGAFTWGVLDRLMEEERFTVTGISGTSAGAMNTVVFADGFIKDGVEGAKRALAGFWEAVSRSSWLSPIQRNPADVLFGNWNLENSPAYLALDIASRMFSPYDLNPFDINPLRDILEKYVDFEAVRACEELKLFITATRVETGTPRVFTNEEITLDVTMASACLPHLYKAVEIGGEPYWDGGYMGNPSLWPLFYGDTCRDVVLVQISPFHRPGTPKTAQEIVDRINEITFNAGLLRELRAVDFVSRLLKEGRLDNTHYREIRMHIIHNETEMIKLEAASKLNTQWEFLKYQHDLGRRTAERWITANYDRVGKESTVDLHAMLN